MYETNIYWTKLKINIHGEEIWGRNLSNNDVENSEDDDGEGREDEDNDGEGQEDEDDVKSLRTEVEQWWTEVNIVKSMRTVKRRRWVVERIVFCYFRV